MQVEIEVVHQNLDKVFVSGWIMSQQKILLDSLSLMPLSVNSKENLIVHERIDVMKAFGVSNEYCIGFIAVFDFESQDSMVIGVQISDQLIEVDLSDKTFIQELVGAESLALGYEDQIETLLSTNGFIPTSEPKEDNTSHHPQTYFDFSIGKSRVHFDHCMKLSANTFLVFGWVIADGFLSQSLRVEANNTLSDDILTEGVFYPRPDVLKALKITDRVDANIGVYMTIVFDKPINTSVDLVWQMSNGTVHRFELPVIEFHSDEIAFTEQLLSNIELTNSRQHSNISKNVIPALQAAWNNRLHADNGHEVRAFGTIPRAPKLSVIIPIYGRYDFVQHQMAQFSLDRDFIDIEVIYVLDDPRITHEFLVTCHGVFEMFRLPFTVVLSSVNLGFSGANNLGFSFANAEHVLFINSDVIPRKSGWTSKFLAEFAEYPNAGIMGATLLYEDETVQHRGMSFCKDPSHDGIWMNYHPQKGFPLNLCDSFSVKQVEAVTGACMLMKKSLYADVHGFDSSYILGDFEDSDLCLRVRQLGYDIFVSGNICLYHLERLSQNIGKANNWKSTLSMINGLMHTNRWDKTITEIKRAAHD